ncbi:MAG: heavy metal translocating P-type ATPase, partial [Clostridiales bacterium]|nr:heavy metal translocating P-type ATPase [Clostridiales bacterium]
PALEAADMASMTDRISAIAEARKIARKTLSIVRQNIVFALGIKALALVLVTVGLGTMWMAVFADVGVALLAILNALRTLRGR